MSDTDLAAAIGRLRTLSEDLRNGRIPTPVTLDWIADSLDAVRIELDRLRAESVRREGK